jgi:chromosome segregation ATPase
LRIVLDNQASSVHVGNDFTYTFQTENGNGDLVYAFLGLPEGIHANRKTGALSGQFAQSGIYTLGLEVADQEGNSAEGFITITVIDSLQTELNDVQLETRVTYNFDLAEVRKEQISADRELFDALAVVNAAKAKLAAKQVAFQQLEAELALAETEADKAAATAAKAKAERERAAERLRLTNKALNDAQDQLNLALLDQAAASDAVIHAQEAVSVATERFNAADAALKAAEARVQQAEAEMSVCRENLLKAENNLKNAQKEFGRASQDLSDAKDDLERAIRRKELAD